MDDLKVGGLSLSFEPPGANAPTLQSQIQQLISQRGALRHITEQSLQAELLRPSSIDQDMRDGEDDDRSDSDDESSQARQEKLWKAREEMLQKLSYAQNEILSALDFVSLLLSGNSSAAQASMSPALKQFVPAGSLESHLVEKQDLSATTKQRFTRISEGWKSGSFKAASLKFGKAATRLEGEAQRQSRYWDQIAELKTHGWSISRLPSDSRAIGVHYGFPESAPQFRNRGFALLQQDESGYLQLDAKTTPDVHTATRVVIVRDGLETGVSQPRQQEARQQSGISELLKKTRDAIFEEELFYELNREARLIANQGVRTQPKAVEALIDSQTLFRIEEIDVDEPVPDYTSGPDDGLAESIATMLHLLLSLEHSKSKLRRSRPPAPMSLVPSRTPEYAILRPILMHLHHQASLTALHLVCDSFFKTLSRAGLRCEFHVAEVKPDKRDSGVDRLRQPARSRLTMRLDRGRDIELDIETYLSAPVYGTVFSSRDVNYDFIQLQTVSLHTFEEARDYLAHILTLDLISQTSEFDVVRPHSGEVTLKASEKTAAVVNVQPERLSLLVTRAQKHAYTWRHSGFQSVPRDGTSDGALFKDVVKKLKG